MTDAKDRILTFRASDASRYQMRMSSLTDYFLDRSFLTFACLCVAVTGVTTIVFSTAIAKTMSVGIFATTVFLFLVILTFVILWLILVGAVLNALEKHGVIRTIYTPIFYLAFLGLCWGWYSIQSPAPRVEEMIWPSVIYIVIFFCIDVMHTRFVAPLHHSFVSDTDAPPERPAALVPAARGTDPFVVPLTHTAAAAPTGAEASDAKPPAGDTLAPPAEGLKAAPDHSLRIANQVFDVDDIRQIRSEDHYLQVSLASETVMLRGKLSDVTQRMPAELGTQINRSIWLAYREIESLSETDRGRLVLTLRDGDSLLVPKMRQLLLQQRFDAYIAQQDQSRPQNA